MKHERAERMLAVVLAAVLLAGCGGASSPEAASSLPRQEKKTHASMDAAGASTPAAEPEAENGADYGFPEHEDPVFTQWEVHKTVVQQDGTRIFMNMEVPQLNNSSPDAVAFNEEMTRLYVEPYKPYEALPEAEKPWPWDRLCAVSWWRYDLAGAMGVELSARFYTDPEALDDYDDPDLDYQPGIYYGTEESRTYYYELDTGRRLTTTQMLERIGLDPADVEQQCYRQAVEFFERGWEDTDTSACPPKDSFALKWWDTLDDLSLKVIDEEYIAFPVDIYRADAQEPVNYDLRIPLFDDSVPENWQQRVLGEWVVFRTEVDGDVCNPAEDGESYTLKLEPGTSPDTVRATLTHISRYGDTTAETRTGVPTRGKIEFAFEGECWQIRCLRPEDENYEWAIALREDGTMTMANMGGDAEYSYISWMDLQRS